MATVLERLLVQLGVDAKDFESGLKKAEKRLKALGDNFKRVGRTLTIGLTVPLTTLGVVAVRSAAKAETLQVAMTRLAGSAKNASEIIKDLTKFAARTPFQLEGLVTSAKQLLAYQFEVKQVVPTIETLADAVAAIGGGTPEFERVIRAMGQMRATGKVLQQDVNQIAQLGIPVKDILAEGFKVTTQELEKLQQKGLDSRDAIEVILQGFRDRFEGTAEALSTTITGLFSTLRDNVAILLRDVGKDIVNALDLKRVLDKTIKGIQNIVDAFKDFSPEAKRTVVNTGLLIAALGPLAAIVGRIITFLASASIAARAFSITILALSAKVAVITAAIGAIVAATIDLARGIAEFKALEKDIKSVGFESLKEFGRAAAPVGDLTKSLEKLDQAVRSQPDATVRLTEAWTSFGLQMKRTVEANKGLRSLLDKVKDRSKSVSDVLKGLGDNLATSRFEAELFGTASDTLGKEIEIAEGRVQTLRTTIQNFAEAAKVNPEILKEVSKEFQRLITQYDSARAKLDELRQSQLSLNEAERAGIQAQQDRLAFMDRLSVKAFEFGEQMRTFGENFVLSLKQSFLTIGEVVGGLFHQVSAGLGNAIANVIVFGQTAGEAFTAFGKQLLANVIQGLVQLGVQFLILVPIAKMVAATLGAVKMQLWSMVTYAAAFAASVETLGLFGIAAGPGIAAAAVATMLAGATAAGKAGAAVGAAVGSFASGGIVTGPTLAMIGEGRGSEAVIPLDRLPELAGLDYRQTIQVLLDGQLLGEVTARELPRFLRVEGIG